jgi:hypothetical protein
MEWLIANWGSLISVIIGVLSVASVITKMTPSPKDDAVVAKLLAWISFLQPRGAGTLKLPLTTPRESTSSDSGNGPFSTLDR